MRESVAASAEPDDVESVLVAVVVVSIEPNAGSGAPLALRRLRKSSAHDGAAYREVSAPLLAVGLIPAYPELALKSPIARVVPASRQPRLAAWAL